MTCTSLLIEVPGIIKLPVDISALYSPEKTMGICFILNVVYSNNNIVKIFILKSPKVAYLMLKLICGQFGETSI